MDQDAIAARISASFASQPAMALIGARLEKVAKGSVEIHMPFAAGITQQHGFLHAGILATALDSACGYAALTTMPVDAGVLTIEFKVNLLAPGAGDWFRLLGRVRKSGRTIVFSEGEAFAVSAAGEKLIATMTATMMSIQNRGNIRN